MELYSICTEAELGCGGQQGESSGVGAVSTNMRLAPPRRCSVLRISGLGAREPRHTRANALCKYLSAHRLSSGGARRSRLHPALPAAAAGLNARGRLVCGAGSEDRCSMLYYPAPAPAPCVPDVGVICVLI